MGRRNCVNFNEKIAVLRSIDRNISFFACNQFVAIIFLFIGEKKVVET